MNQFDWCRLCADISKQRCLILGTDGAWNVLSPEMAVSTVRQAERNNEKHMLEGTGQGGGQWLNPSKQLVDQAVERWRACKLRADNTSVVVVMLDILRLFLYQTREIWRKGKG